MKVFCLPPAGGSAANYIKYVQKSDHYVTFIPIEYPGHGALLKHNALEDMSSLVKYVAKKIADYLSKTDDFIIFGHSMGAMIAYEIAQHLDKNKDDRIRHVFFCGCVSPACIIDTYNKYVLMSDDDFVEQIHAFGGIKKEMMNNSVFREVFLKILRTDFRIISEYIPRMDEMNISVNIMVAEDDILTKGKYKSWKMFCSNIDFHIFTGGHFFVFNNPKVLDTLYSYCSILHQ